MQSPDQIADVLGMTADKFTGGLPVTEFKGTLHDARSEFNQERSRYQVALEFTDCDIIKTTIPWNYPTLTITMNHSVRRNSGIGLLSQSIQRIAGAETTVRDMVGKRLHMDRSTVFNFGENDDGTPRNYAMWELREVIGEGIGGVSVNPIDRALSILDGKRMPEFNSLALADPVLKAHPEITSMILSENFVTGLIAGGRATVDSDGVHHVNESY